MIVAIVALAAAQDAEPVQGTEPVEDIETEEDVEVQDVAPEDMKPVNRDPMLEASEKRVIDLRLAKKIKSLQVEVIEAADCDEDERVAMYDSIVIKSEGYWLPKINRDNGMLTPLAQKDEPFTIQVGAEHMLPGMEKAVIDMCPGHKVSLSPTGSGRAARMRMSHRLSRWPTTLLIAVACARVCHR